MDTPVLNNVVKVITSYHDTKIERTFEKYVKGFLSLKHFSIAVVPPNKKITLLSTSKQFSEQFEREGLFPHDNALSSLMYENLEYYSWTEGYIKLYENAIRNIKINQFKLSNGCVFVRKLDGFHLLYGMATENPDPILKSNIVNKANSILSLGDHLYTTHYNTIKEHMNGIEPPAINKFVPFLHEEIPCLSSYEKANKVKVKHAKYKTHLKHGNHLKLIVNKQST